MKFRFDGVTKLHSAADRGSARRGYTFRYVFEDSIGDDSESASTSETELTLTPINDGSPAPADVPLSGAATAGLLTLGGLGLARLRKWRRV